MRDAEGADASGLRARRVAAGLTLRQAAERTGYSMSHLSNVKRGAKRASAEVVRGYLRLQHDVSGEHLRARWRVGCNLARWKDPPMTSAFCRARLFGSLPLGRLTAPSGSPQVDRNRRSKARRRKCNNLTLSALPRYWAADAAAALRLRARTKRSPHPKPRPRRPRQ